MRVGGMLFPASYLREHPDYYREEPPPCIVCEGTGWSDNACTIPCPECYPYEDSLFDE